MLRIAGPADGTPEDDAPVSLDEVLAHIVHELRSPLTAISGYAELALQAEGQDTSEFLEAIARGARELDRRLSNLADDAGCGAMRQAIEARRRPAADRGR
jgi:signal transduction histidine kinase